MHKKINPKNKEWDKFYLVNYLEFGKTWEDIAREDDCGGRGEEELPSGWDTDDKDGGDNDWSDWRGLWIVVIEFTLVEYMVEVV